MSAVIITGVVILFLAIIFIMYKHQKQTDQTILKHLDNHTDEKDTTVIYRPIDSYDYYTHYRYPLRWWYPNRRPYWNRRRNRRLRHILKTKI